ncbi:dihydroorotase [Gammaproteobacteria bacterium 45_16_T64]|nr:dihydroorotase [Gammaproteobacteria bacterium 45_16_T64]
MNFSPTTSLSKSIKITGGRLIDPASDHDALADIYIADGLVQEISPAGSKNAKPADITIDASGKWVLPGAVDLCARVREPGEEYKGTIHTETKAAAAGGITHLCCPPDTQPVIDSAAVAALIQERAHQSGYAQVLPIGAMTQGLQGSQLSEMHSLHSAGCVGVSQLRRAVKDNRVLLRCLEYAATFNLTVFFQSVDLSLQGDGIVHESFTSTRLGLPGIPRSAETVALARDLLLVEQTGVTAHFGQLSCARSVELIASAQQRGLPVTADIAAHQLLFTEKSVDGFNSQFHVNPPFRSESDQRALINALQSGVISTITSDHQPHETAAKSAPFSATEAGISAIETLLTSTYKLVSDGVLTPLQWVSCLTNAPANIINFDAGKVAINTTANISIFDPNTEWTLAPELLHSEGKNTPLLNHTIMGQNHATICQGRLVYQLT